MFGTAAIILAGLTLFFSGIEALIGWSNDGRSPTSGQPASDLLAALAMRAPVELAEAGATSVLCALLLAGGIGLLYRCAWSGRALLAWALLQLGVTVATAVLMILASRALAASRPGPPLVLNGWVRQVGGALQLVQGWFVPLTAAVWFALPSIRCEMAAWRKRGTRPARVT